MKYIKYWMNSSQIYHILEFYVALWNDQDIFSRGEYLYNHYGYGLLKYGDDQVKWDYQEISEEEYEKNRITF